MPHLVPILALLLQVQATNAELGYRFTLPAGFTPFPEAQTQKDVLGCWSEETPASTHGGMVLCVSRLHGVLPREAMRQRDVPANTRIVTFKWKGFDVQGLHTSASQNGEPVFALVAQVPLRREAVQVVFAGPADQEARGNTLMTSTLGTLEGETNWLTDSERAGRLGNIAGWWIGIAIAVVAVLIWRNRRHAPAVAAPPRRGR